MGRQSKTDVEHPKPSCTWELLWEYVGTLPGTELSTSYGTPSFKVKGKFMARLWEDGETLVLRIDFETADMLLNSNSEVYFITDHYKGYPAVLAHIPLADYDELCELLEQSWRMRAPKRLVTEWEQQGQGQGRGHEKRLDPHLPELAEGY